MPMPNSTDVVFDEPGTLMQETLALIEKSGKSLPQLYRETGVPFYWLKKFVSGEFTNPSVNRVQFLYEHLSGKRIVS